MGQGAYQRIVIAYHGCDAAVLDSVLAGHARLKASTNSYDWLGEGIYFWEHGPQRAYDWAAEHAPRRGSVARNPSVLAARIDLGVCLDLLDTANTRLLGRWYASFRHFVRGSGREMPLNRVAPGTRASDRVLRFLDCAVVDYSVRMVAETEGTKYQTVRGIFIEGQPAFPGSKIALKSHIQLAVRDPACIIELFRVEPANYEQKT
jgi:hypothetical protein